MKFRPFLLLLGALLCAPAAASAALGIKPDGHLDMQVLRKAYMESEFDKVRASLEGFQKKHPENVSREEKIFTHMYLGVICAADSNSQVKAESHFNALLQLSPHIEPVDMFVPPKIQALFDRIKQDFLKRAEYEKKYDAFGNPIAQPQGDSLARPAMTGGTGASGTHNAKSPTGKAPAGKTPAVSDSDHDWIWWTVGSAVLVAAGVGYYALSGSDKAPAPQRDHADGSSLP